MRRVEALASDILATFRRSQGANKRTLVSAQQTTANKYRKTDDESKIATAVNKQLNINFVKANETIEELETGSANHRKFRKLLKDVVLFKVNDEADNVNYNNCIRKTIEQNKNGQFSEFVQETTYSCSYNGQVLVKVTGQSQKKAKAKGFENLYRLLQNYCHTLVKKVKFFSGDVKAVEKPGQIIVDKPAPLKKSVETYDEHKLGNDNIGFRMLKALGWKEGDNKGIVDPIGLSVKIGRAGLGSEPKKGQKLNIDYFRKLMINFRESGSDFDLVFSSEFAKEERAELHKLAQKLGLKSKSEGKVDERFLTVRRKTSLSPQEILHKIKSNDPFYSAVWHVEAPALKDYETLNL